MNSELRRAGPLSAGVLKILACLFMLIDHIGARMFPAVLWLRILGRLAYPIFAFFIAEGCRYTRNKTRRFLQVFVLGLLCETVYIFYGGGYYGNILLTFSMSIVLIYCLQAVKKQLCRGDTAGKLLSLGVFAGALAGVYLFVSRFGVDYDFAGVLAPVFAAIPDYKDGEAPAHLKRWDRLWVRLALFSFGLVLVAGQYGGGNPQIWSLLAVPLLALYSGKPGKRGMKYGFYIFYPLHLILIELAALLLGV